MGDDSTIGEGQGWVGDEGVLDEGGYVGEWVEAGGEAAPEWGCEGGQGAVEGGEFGEACGECG